MARIDCSSMGYFDSVQKFAVFFVDVVVPLRSTMHGVTTVCTVGLCLLHIIV